MYSQDSNFSTRRVAKLIVYFGKLLKAVDNKRCKYLMGSLFALGGLMKIEAKSYLKSISERRDNFVAVCSI